MFAARTPADFLPRGNRWLSPLLIAYSKTPQYLLSQMANRHGLVAGATGTGKTVTLQVMAEAFSRIGVPVFAADVKGDLSGISQPGKDSPKIAERVKKTEARGLQARRLARDVLGRLRRTGTSRAHDGLRNGSAAVQPAAQPERHADGRAVAGVQDCRRPSAAAARPERPAGDVAVRRRSGQGAANGVRQHLGRQRGRDSARAGYARTGGRRQVLWRAGAQHRRPDADRRATAAAWSTFSRPTSSCARRGCMPRSCCGC